MVHTMQCSTYSVKLVPRSCGIMGTLGDVKNRNKLQDVTCDSLNMLKIQGVANTTCNHPNCQKCNTNAM